MLVFIHFIMLITTNVRLSFQVCFVQLSKKLLLTSHPAIKEYCLFFLTKEKQWLMAVKVCTFAMTAELLYQLID